MGGTREPSAWILWLEDAREEPAQGEVTFEVPKGVYHFGPLRPGSQVYVAAYEENGTWTATAIFVYR